MSVASPRNEDGGTFFGRQDQLRAACYAICGNNHLAEDLFQETAIACWRGYHMYDPQKATFSAWVHGILRHVHADHYRRRDNRHTLLSPAALARILDVAAESEHVPLDRRQALLQGCLDQLVGRRTATVGIYATTINSAARPLPLGQGAVIAAVKKGLSRARAHLATCMGARLESTNHE